MGLERVKKGSRDLWTAPYHNDVSHNVSHFPVSRPSPGSLGSIHHGSGHSITPWASLNHLRRLNTWVMSIITENRRQHRSQFHAAYQSQDITSSPEKNRLKHPQPQHPGFCQESKLRPRLITIKISVCCLQPELWNCGLEELFLCLRRKGVVNYCKVSMLTVKIRLMGRLHAFLLCTSRSFTSFAQF